MSKDLPYFKFHTAEWLNGDITLEDYALQGIFVNLCAFYWHKECELTIDQACRKLRIESTKIDDLLDNGLIEIYVNGDGPVHIRIKFLDEQYEEFHVRKIKLSEAGKKGALIKKNKVIEATLQPPLNHPEAIREEKIIEEQKNEEVVQVSAKAESLNWDALLIYYNELFGTAKRVIPDSVKRSFKARLKEGYTKSDIRQAMTSVKNDPFHKENAYKHATIEYFSRSKTLDMHGSQQTPKQTKYVPR